MPILFALLLGLSGILSLGEAVAQADPARKPSTGSRLSDEERRAIVNDVVTHFREHPDQLVEAIFAGRKRSDPVALLSANDPSSGNRAGDVTVIEFPDVGCAPCRQVSANLETASRRDGFTRVIHKDLPKSGVAAKQATLMLLASTPGGRMRGSIMGSLPTSGPIDAETMANALVAAGAEQATGESIDTARDLLARNAALAGKMGIEGLPAIVVMAGDKVQVLTGPQTEEDILSSIKAMREAARTR